MTGATTKGERTSAPLRPFQRLTSGSGEYAANLLYSRCVPASETSLIVAILVATCTAFLGRISPQVARAYARVGVRRAFGNGISTSRKPFQTLCTAFS